ncbi:MAG TPA: hypothetical protein VFN63_07325 [Pseudolabrys sp.]|nr:hypothetical protein [Pseudolabrys sp.]
MTREGRYLLVTALMGGIVGYLLGLNSAYVEMSASKLALQQSRAENQKMKSEMAGENVKVGAMESGIAKLQTKLDELIPSENTYNIKANQSLIVGEGRLTVGLIGAPANDSVTLNINGKRQQLGTGDVLNVAADNRTNCQVRVQSFDMFKAVVTATCGNR